MAYNQIQLFALNITPQLTLPFELYALEVPQHWKELFTRLQEIKLERKEVSPPTKCLNHYLQVLIEDLIFPSPDAFKTYQGNWFYSKSNLVDRDDIATIVKTWVRISFESLKNFSESDRQLILAISGNDLKFKKINISELVWEVRDGKLHIDPIYYRLISYLFTSAIVSKPLTLINPDASEERTFHFRESITSDGKSEVISWNPELIVRGKGKEKEKEKENHYHSYHATFNLNYHPNGVPYLNCEYGVRRWISWKLGYLPTETKVYLSPTKSKRFAPANIKYMGEQRGLDFEGNLGRLIQELERADKFTTQDIIDLPCNHHSDGLNWVTVYNTRISKSHHAGAGLFPTDIASFHKACLHRIQDFFGTGVCEIEAYSRCDNTKALKSALSQHNKIKEFIKSELAIESDCIPFKIPDNLQLILMIQTPANQLLVEKLAAKYGIKNVKTIGIGKLGTELPGANLTSDYKDRIREFKESPELIDALSTSLPGSKKLAFLEILPKTDFWGNDAKKDPKPCFRPALAELDCVTKCFEPEKPKQEKTSESHAEAEPSETEFIRRVENSLLRGLVMTGAYIYPEFKADNFPTDVACVGVYAISCGKKFFPVAVRIDRNGIMARGYGSEWIDIYDFQIKMARNDIFNPIEFKNKSKMQNWVFNNLFEETQAPTIYCFDAQNLRTKGLVFLQKQHWRQDSLAFHTDGPTRFIPLSEYPHVRIAAILTPESLEVPIYRACDESGNLEGNTKGVFHSSSQDAECGYYYLSNQKPSNRTDPILQKSKFFSTTTKAGKSIKPNLSAQGYNPTGIMLTLTLQQEDVASDWASFIQCQRLYGLTHHFDATNYPAPLHLAKDLSGYLPIQEILKQ
jgi:pPIWI_RE module N-terminal domain/RNaseH domain of pPIWI_RE/MID domain of pPIWI_RE